MRCPSSSPLIAIHSLTSTLLSPKCWLCSCVTYAASAVVVFGVSSVLVSRDGDGDEAYLQRRARRTDEG